MAAFTSRRVYLRQARAYAPGVTALALLLMIPATVHAECTTSICGTSPCTVTGTHTMDDGCVLDFGTKDVILTGTLQGDNNTNCFYILAHDFTLRGTLRAHGSCVVAQVTGTFKTEIVSNSAARIDTRDADDPFDGATIEAASVVLNGRDINADGATGSDGGAISVTATNGSVTGSGSSVSLHATGAGGGWGGSIEVFSDTSSINLPASFDASGGGTFAFGGSIFMEAATSVTVGTSTRSIEAQGAGDGDGGSIEIDADAGTATVNGNLNVNGNGDFAFGGSILVQGDDVTTGTTWNARGDQSGTGGTIEIDALEANHAGTVTTTNGSASFNTLGGAGGGDGGDIDLTATGSITLAGDMDSGGVGEFSTPGWITIEGGTGSSNTVTVQSTSRIEADGSGTDASDGSISISGCNISISGDLDTRNTTLSGGGGFNTLTYAGTLTTTSTASVLADNLADGGENDVVCRCPDTSPADGVCDSATCVSSPTLGGTITPSATIIPTAMAACD